MGDILAGRSWEGNRPFIVTCIVEGMEMGKPRSGEDWMGEKSEQVVYVGLWIKDAAY